MRRRRVVWAIVLACGVIAGCATAPTTSVLSAADLATFHIRDAVDVTTVAQADLPPTVVSRSEAIGIAQAEIGGTSKPVEVLHAWAPRSLDEPDRSVWVVVFPGGTIPFDGPAGGPAATDPTVARAASTSRLTGVIVDDTTGEFLRGFMH